jgi:peroxiredoxin
VTCSITTCGSDVERRRGWLGAAALALALATAGCAHPEPVPGGAPSRSTRDFTLRDTTGRTVRLSDHLGKKVILLNFWATWCVPCAAELPHLQRLYEAHKDEGLIVLAISMDGPESIANVAPQARRYGLTFPVLLDEETRVVGAYNPKGAAPFNVLIDRSGAIVKTREGYSAGDEVSMAADIQAILGVGAR